MQQDPMSFGSGDSTFVYNNPANYHDPTGLSSMPSCTQIVAAVLVIGGAFASAYGGEIGGSLFAAFKGISYLTGLTTSSMEVSVMGGVITTAYTAAKDTQFWTGVGYGTLAAIGLAVNSVSSNICNNLENLYDNFDQMWTDSFSTLNGNFYNYENWTPWFSGLPLG
jgi:hypothetical protein